MMRTVTTSIVAVVVSTVMFGSATAGAEAPRTVSPGASDRIMGVESRCPTFSWGALPGAGWYEISVYELAEDITSAAEADLADAIEVVSVRVPGSALSWTPPRESALAPGRVYVWFVRATPEKSGDGIRSPSDWSIARLFRVADAPTPYEVEEAMRVLRRYVGVEAGDPGQQGPITAPGRLANSQGSVRNESTLKVETDPFGLRVAANTDATVAIAGLQPGNEYSDLPSNFWEPGGYFAGRNGVIGYTKESGGYAVFGFKEGSSGYAGRFISELGGGVYISTPAGQTGLSVVGGSKNAVVPTASGNRLLYVEESTEVWFTDYGFAELRNGRATVAIDPIFAQTVNLGEPYHVFLEMYDDGDAYVCDRSSTSFEVCLRSGEPRAAFSYRIVAKRLQYEHHRLEPVDFSGDGTDTAASVTESVGRHDEQRARHAAGR